MKNSFHFEDHSIFLEQPSLNLIFLSGYSIINELGIVSADLVR